MITFTKKKDRWHWQERTLQYHNAFSDVKNELDSFSRFDKTDLWQTDRQTQYISANSSNGTKWQKTGKKEIEGKGQMNAQGRWLRHLEMKVHDNVSVFYQTGKCAWHVCLVTVNVLWKRLTPGIISMTSDTHMHCCMT